MSRMTRPKGPSALVTGASGGIGHGIALRLAREGVRVAVNYFNDAAGADRTVREESDLGSEAFAVQADVGVAADVQKMCDAVVDKFGRDVTLVKGDLRGIARAWRLSRAWYTSVSA